MVSWSRAWRAAGAWLVWSLVWGVIGIVFIGLGIFLVFGYYFFGGGPSPNEVIISGLFFIVIGFIVSSLAAVASFFKINSEITTEEINSKKRICPTCDQPLRFIPKYHSWYCDTEQKYV